MCVRGRGRYLHSTHHLGHGIIIPPTDEEDIEVQRAGLAQGHSSACQSHCHSTLQLTPESFERSPAPQQLFLCPSGEAGPPDALPRAPGQ